MKDRRARSLTEGDRWIDRPPNESLPGCIRLDAGSEFGAPSKSCKGEG